MAVVGTPISGATTVEAPAPLAPEITVTEMPTHKRFTTHYPPASAPHGLYAVVQHGGTGDAWNGSALEPYDVTHWATYARPMTRVGDTDMWKLEVPIAALPIGEGFYVLLHLQAGAAPAATDRRLASTFSRDWGESSDAENGNGDIAVTHHYGSTDALRVMRNGLPVDNVTLRAYPKAEYESGTLDPSPPTTRTGSDGRWTAPLMLDPDTYTLTAHDPATRTTTVRELVVT